MSIYSVCGLQNQTGYSDCKNSREEVYIPLVYYVTRVVWSTFITDSGRRAASIFREDDFLILKIEAER
jgi:hypothetical protein